jgi:hypothetical protein
VDDNKPTPQPKPNDAIDLKQCYLIVVLQRKSMPVEYAMTMDDDDFWRSFVPEKLGENKFRELQPGTEDAKQFEAAAKIPAPFVMLVPVRGPPVWAMPLPKGTTDPIKEKLGG